MNNITWISLLIIIILLVNTHFYKETFKEKEKKEYDCIISINVHEKFDFLLKQLKNIEENISCKYAVMLNCNDYMFEQCNNNRTLLPENVYFYDTPLNKKTYHGSLTEGIFNNMYYSVDNFNFKYFIISSSRNFFSNNLTLEDLNNLNNKDVLKSVQVGKIKYDDWEEKKNDWRWPSFSNTLLAKYLLEQKQDMYSCPHEGLVFTYNGCIKITDFLNNNSEIKNDLFNYNDNVEEFSLQTLSKSLGEPFFYIGNGCCSNNPIGTNNPHGELLQFMYKTNRDGFINKESFLTCNL
jgi:hypothetical protein